MAAPRHTAGELATAWREHWPYVKLAAALFALGALLGAALLVLDVDLFAMLGIEAADDALVDEFTTATILVNNTGVFILTVVGIFSFGLLTALVLLFNGAVVGFVAIPAAGDVGVGFVLVALLPHGILELPALFVAAAVAFRLLHRFAQRVRDRRERLLEPGELPRIGLLLAVAWLVLAIAAAVEVHVTVWLVETLFPELPETAV